MEKPQHFLAIAGCSQKVMLDQAHPCVSEYRGIGVSEEEFGNFLNIGWLAVARPVFGDGLLQTWPDITANMRPCPCNQDHEVAPDTIGHARIAGAPLIAKPW